MSDSLQPPWTMQSMEFSRPEYWKRLLFPTPGDLPNPEIEPMSPALSGGFFTTEPPGKPFFLNQLSVDVHLGHFYVLAVANSAAITLGYMYLFRLRVFVFFLDICSRVELLDHMVALFSVS